MPLEETIYCSEQIPIPPELPDILKQFSKAAVRTQPQDLLQWAVAYFSALSKGEPLPVKQRLELQVADQTKGTSLTPGLLKVLHKQLSPKEAVTKEDVYEKWIGLCLPTEQLESILAVGNFDAQIDWMQFFALSCSALSGTLMSSMKHACEILTDDPEGGAARISFHTFKSLYTYLAHLDEDITEEQINNFLQSLEEHVERQAGMVKPTNFMGSSSVVPE